MRKQQKVAQGQLSLLQYIACETEKEVVKTNPAPSSKKLACVVKTTPRQEQAKTKFPQKRERLDGLFRHYLAQHTALQRIMRFHREIALTTLFSILSSGYY